MRYFVSFGDGAASEAAIDVTELPSGALEVRVGERTLAVDVAEGAHGLNVVVDGRVVDLVTEGAPPDVGLVAGGLRTYARVESERLRAAAAGARKGGGQADGVAKAPMPGRVVRVLCAEGDAVAVGQPLCVVEAMKMENEVKAKAAGTVAKVHRRRRDRRVAPCS